MFYFIDDERVPRDVTWVRLPELPAGATWTIIRSYDQWAEALRYIDKIGAICFDHDLGFGHGLPDHSTPTGHDCAKLLIEWCLDYNHDLPPFVVHSMNPVGKKNIEGLLRSFMNR